ALPTRVDVPFAVLDEEILDPIALEADGLPELLRFRLEAAHCRGMRVDEGLGWAGPVLSVGTAPRERHLAVWIDGHDRDLVADRLLPPAVRVQSHRRDRKLEKLGRADPATRGGRFKR